MQKSLNAYATAVYHKKVTIYQREQPCHLLMNFQLRRSSTFYFTATFQKAR